MNADETRRAAQVMLDSLKPGAVVEYKLLDDPLDTFDRLSIAGWDWLKFDYRIAEPKHTKIADLPPVCWISSKTDDMSLVVGIEHNHVFHGGTVMTLEQLRIGNCKYSPDRINWTPFV